MSVPSTPTSLTLTNKAQGIVYAGTDQWSLGQSYFVSCSPCSGATGYVFNCTEYGDFPMVSTPYATLPDPLNPLTGILPGATLTNLKVKAVNASGASAYYTPGSPLTETGVANAATTGNLGTVTPLALLRNADGSYSLEYSFVPGSNTCEAFIFYQLLVSSVVVASGYLPAVSGIGSTVLWPIPSSEYTPGTTYTIHMGCWGFTASGGLVNGRALVTNSTATTGTPGLYWVSPLTVTAGVPFSLNIPAGAGSTFSPAGPLPAGVSIDPTGLMLTGTAATAGNYPLLLIQTIGGSSQLTVLNLTVGPAMTVSVSNGISTSLPTDTVGGAVTPEYQGWIGDQLSITIGYSGPGTASSSWSIINQPLGVSIVPSGTTNAVAYISGAPTAAGIFEGSVVQIATASGGGPILQVQPLRWAISGGLFRAWFHDNQDNVDLQVTLRDRALQSYTWGNAGFSLLQDDTVTWTVLFREGTAAAPARNLITDGFSALRLTIRKQDDFSSDPLLDLVADTITTAVIGTNTVMQLTFTVRTPAIDAAFVAIDSSGTPSSNAVSIACTAELQWTRNGQTLHSQSAPGAILQSLNR